MPDEDIQIAFQIVKLMKMMKAAEDESLRKQDLLVLQFLIAFTHIQQKIEPSTQFWDLYFYFKKSPIKA